MHPDGLMHGSSLMSACACTHACADDMYDDVEVAEELDVMQRELSVSLTAAPQDSAAALKAAEAARLAPSRQ